MQSRMTKLIAFLIFSSCAVHRDQKPMIRPIASENSTQIQGAQDFEPVVELNENDIAQKAIQVEKPMVANQNESSEVKPAENYDSESLEDSGFQIKTLSDNTPEEAPENDTSENDAPMSKQEQQINRLGQLSSNFLQKKYSPLFKKWLHYFSKQQKDRFQRFLINGEKYRPLIEKIFEQHGLPKELFYVGLIESGYYLHAKSRAAAVGPWQFIRSTGKRYGLKITRNIDERKDIYKATQAAAYYFKDLYNIFGSWELALCAYNAGEYGLIKRIRKANSRDFYQLVQKRMLPRETINYVPKVLAAMYLSKHHHKYGINRLSYPNPFQNTIKIPLKYSHSLGFLANKLNLSIKNIRSLNPELVSKNTPYFRSKPYLLRIPKKTYQKDPDLVTVLKSIKTRVSQRVRYKVSSSDRRKKKTKRNRKSKAYRYQKTSKKSAAYYRVKRGDSLFKISKWTGIPVRKIMQHNRLKRAQIRPRQRLKLPGGKISYYTVRRGDNIHKIARNFGKTTSSIKAMNNLRTARIYPGQKLFIYQR